MYISALPYAFTVWQIIKHPWYREYDFCEYILRTMQIIMIFKQHAYYTSNSLLSKTFCHLELQCFLWYIFKNLQMHIIIIITNMKVPRIFSNTFSRDFYGCSRYAHRTLIGGLKIVLWLLVLNFMFCYQRVNFKLIFGNNYFSKKKSTAVQQKVN
jgi:hypothetical protein